MIRSSVDLPQPDGPMSETNSPGAMSRIDALERGRDRLVAAGEDLVDAGEVDDGLVGHAGLGSWFGAWSGVGRQAPARRPRRTIFSASRIRRKKAMPSSAVAKIAAQSFSGPVM